jgi:micrococcal nuclease
MLTMKTPSRLALIAIPLALLLWVSPCLARSAQGFSARVVKVFDGDSFIAKKGSQRLEVRLFGVDCPEGRQARGNEARTFTKRLILNQTVRIQQMDQDRYKRIVGRVYLLDGRELNRLLLEAGLAWWYQRHAPKRLDLAEAMVGAWKNKKGLWQDANPQPPWEWRRENRRRR